MADASGGVAVIAGSCPECGGPYEAGLWDRSHACEYCRSLLIFPETRDQVYAIGNAEAFEVLEVFFWDELRRFRAELLARFRIPEGPSLEIPALIDAQVERREEALRAETEVVESIDFYAPYHVRSETIWQGILGRRGSVKESFSQVFQSHDLERGYDPASYPLRDAGLKIHALRLEPLRPEDLERAAGRFLPLRERRPEHALTLDRSRVRLDERVQVVSRFGSAAPARDLLVYKNLVFARIHSQGRTHALLIDRQFGTIAARLQPGELDLFRGIATAAPEGLGRSAALQAVASECPDCGFELCVPEGEHTTPCPECRRAVAVTSKGLQTVECRFEPPPAEAASTELVYLPYWAFPFVVETARGLFRNLWSWLEAASPEQRARSFAQSDPEQSLLYVPARALYGTPALDRAGTLATSWACWRQPELSRDRPAPRADLSFLGADVDAAEAAAARRFALLALHDNASTRRLNGLNFRELIADARFPDTKPPFLAMLALPIRRGLFSLEGQGPGVERSTLELDRQAARTTKTYNLR